MRSATGHAGAFATVERSIQAGQLVRVLPDLPISLYLADAKVASMPCNATRLRAPAPPDDGGGHPCLSRRSA